MTLAIVTETRGLPGVPESAEAASIFVREALKVAGCPDSTSPGLCVSKLVAVSAGHSRSAGRSGTILLRVDTWPGGARIEVRDAGPRRGADTRAIPGAGRLSSGEPDRARRQVALAADRSGFGPCVAWCQFSWPAGTAVPILPPVAGPIRRARRRPGRAGRARYKLAIWWHHRRYAAHPLEREARRIYRMPSRHPEILTRGRHELDALAEQLWPGDEYMTDMP